MLEEWSLVLETWLRYCCCEPLTLFPPHDLLTERLLCHFDLSKRAGFKVFTKVVELVRKVYEMSSGIKIKPKLPPLILWLDVLFPQDLHVPWLPYDKTWVCSSMSHQNQYLRSKITTYNLPFLQYFGYKKKNENHCMKLWLSCSCKNNWSDTQNCTLQTIAAIVFRHRVYFH